MVIIVAYATNNNLHKETDMYQTITREQIKERIKNQLPTQIVEALPQRYFDDAHLPDAINIPHDEVRDLAGSMLPNKEAFIVVYCANTPCNNSKIATNTLMQMGYSNVFEYVEGKQDWIEANYPLEKSQIKQTG